MARDLHKGAASAPVPPSAHLQEVWMNASFQYRRWLAGPLAAAMLIAAVAPAAYADHGHGKRYKRDKHISKHVEHSYRGGHYDGGSVYVVRQSSAGPAIAGFLGGLFLGATIAHAAPAGYYYNDPYCHERFASLEIYRSHLYHHHHPRIVQVVSFSSGACVGTGRYDDGRWQDAGGYYDPNWDRGTYSAGYEDGCGGNCGGGCGRR